MSKRKQILSSLLTLIILICLALLGYLVWQDYAQERQNDMVLEALQPTSSGTEETTPSPESSSNDEVTNVQTSSPSETNGDDSSAFSENITEAPQEPLLVTNPYESAFLANSDMKAWIQIPGTEIDYPVMWTPEDENYYLYKDFEGKENKNGSLILDTDSCLDPITTNLIIHGHNMKSGAMFGTLTDYEDEDYYLEHPHIILYTEECQRNYEIIAVFRSQVYKKSDTVFKFYKFFQADTQEEFEDFYNNIKELSLYDTGVTASFGDRFLTLSTCVYHVTNGRFVVVAKEVEPGDSYLPVGE